MIEPVKKFRITSHYGVRILNGRQEMHTGIDLVSKVNSRDVFAIADGFVILDFDGYDDSKRWSDPKHSAGNYIIIKHTFNDEEYYVRYLHLLVNYVKLKEEVKEGQKIGEYADVGISYGAHLHLDLCNKAWQKIDPTDLFIFLHQTAEADGNIG